MPDPTSIDQTLRQGPFVAIGQPQLVSLPHASYGRVRVAVPLWLTRCHTRLEHDSTDDSTSFARRPPAFGDTYAIPHEYAALRAICIQIVNCFCISKRYALCGGRPFQPYIVPFMFVNYYAMLVH